jgi:hypothetical protein
MTGYYHCFLPHLLHFIIHLSSSMRHYIGCRRKAPHEGDGILSVDLKEDSSGSKDDEITTEWNYVTRKFVWLKGNIAVFCLVLPSRLIDPHEHFGGNCCCIGIAVMSSSHQISHD